MLITFVSRVAGGGGGGVAAGVAGGIGTGEVGGGRVMVVDAGGVAPGILVSVVVLVGGVTGDVFAGGIVDSAAGGGVTVSGVFGELLSSFWKKLQPVKRRRARLAVAKIFFVIW